MMPERQMAPIVTQIPTNMLSSAKRQSESTMVHPKPDSMALIGVDPSMMTFMILFCEIVR